MAERQFHFLFMKFINLLRIRLFARNDVGTECRFSCRREGEVLVILVSNLRLLVFMGRVYYLVYNLSTSPASPRNVSTYALNCLATSDIKRCED